MDGRRVQHALDRACSADLAAVRRGVAHPLEELERVPVGTAVVVRRHAEDFIVPACTADIGTLTVEVPTERPRGRWYAPAVLTGDTRADASLRSFWLAVGAATAGVAAFLLAQLHAWPPHEDETLALFVGHKPIGELIDVVLEQRGGAPLHFLLVHAVTELSPTLTALRLLSVVFAVASIPVVALVAARLADRRTSLIATAIVAASWVTLFHGIYGRMYSLFLFTSALAFLALLKAIRDNSRLSWALWALAMLAALASHQYGAFVLGIQVIYVGIARLRGEASIRPGIYALAAVAVAALPLWRSNLVLASRYDVGVGSGGEQLGGPWPVLEYLRLVLGDFVAGWTALFAAVAALAVVGLVVLFRRRPLTFALCLLVFAVPLIGLALARVGGSAGTPETRHLIFALPFFAIAVATGLLRLGDRAGQRAPAVLAVAVAALLAAEIAWGWARTPTLYAGEPLKRREAREAAVAWLAATSRPDDVYFGYDPLYLGAREHGADVGRVVVPRADPKLALEVLTSQDEPLGRGVWVLDASDGSRIVSPTSTRLEIDDRSPGFGFETRVFGPFLIIRSADPTMTPERFLWDTRTVNRMGYWDLDVPTAAINYDTAQSALDELAAQEEATALARP